MGGTPGKTFINRVLSFKEDRFWEARQVKIFEISKVFLGGKTLIALFWRRSN